MIARRIVFMALFLVVVLLAASGVASAADFGWPVEGRILRSFEKDVHRGIDIEATEGAKVKAAVSGTVTYVGYSEGSSSDLYHTVSIEYGSEGYHTSYLQIKPLVAKGESVVQGQEIGEVIKSTDDKTTAAHLHFSVWQKTDSSRIYRNPLDFLPQLTLSEQTQLSSEQAPATQPLPSGEGAQPLTSPQVAPVAVEPSVDASAPQSVQNESVSSVPAAPSTESVPPTPTGPDTPIQATVPAESVSQADASSSANQVPAPLPPNTEVSSTPLEAAAVTEKLIADTNNRPQQTEVAAPQKASRLSPRTLRLVAPKAGFAKAAPITPAAITPVTEGVDSGTKSITSLKDKQIEALGSMPSSRRELVAPASRLQYKALGAQTVAENRAVSTDVSSAVILRLLFYFLMLISSLGFARISRGQAGPPAHP